MKRHPIARAGLGGRAVTALALSSTLCLPLWLGGCGTEPLRIHDNEAPAASLEAVYRFRPDSAGGLRLRYDGWRAASRQHLDDGETLLMGTQPLWTGPLDLRQRASLRQGFLGYQHHLFADRPVRLQWHAGVAWSRLRWTSLTATDTPQRFAWDFESFGPSGGLRASWQALPWLALEAGASGALSRWSGGLRASIDTSQVDLGLALTLAEPVHLRLGWSRRSLSAITQGDPSTRFEAGTRGPYLGLAFEFR